MDGTIFDTNKEIFLSMKLTLKEYGKNIKYKDTKPFFGRGAIIYTRGIAKKFKIKEDIEVLLNKRTKYSKQLRKKPLKVFPGIIPLLKELKKHKIKTAIATGSKKSSVNLHIKRTKINKKLFNIIISREDVKKTKPHPEVFLKAAKKLKVKPNECVVIEDAISGIKAGKKANMKVIAVTNSFKKSELKADLVVNSAKKLSLKKLNSL